MSWHRCEFTEKNCHNNCKNYELSYVSLDVFSLKNSLQIHNNNKNAENTLAHLDQYMAQHGCIVKQSKWSFCLIKIKH